MVCGSRVGVGHWYISIIIFMVLVLQKNTLNNTSTIRLAYVQIPKDKISWRSKTGHYGLEFKH